MTVAGLSAHDLSLLEADGFDPAGFARVVEMWRTGKLDRDLVIPAGRISPPMPGDLVSMPPEGAMDRARLEAAGREAIDTGLVGAVVLNGGMATRFGGVVKGTVEVLDGRSFIDLKISQLRSVGPRLRIYLMDSPATHAPTLEHLSRPGLAQDPGIWTFVQPVAPRLTPDGGIARDPQGRVSAAGMGHGDMPPAFARQRLGGFLATGGRVVFVSNVDNLGACLDPLLVGMHLASGSRVTVEVAPRRPEDRGGMPVRLDARPALLEGIRMPPDFDPEGFPAFNTNTFYIDAELLAGLPELPAWPVVKDAAAGPVIQFERILGEITHVARAAFVWVPVDGPGSRFIPVKRREDLEAQRQSIRQCLRRWGVA